MIRRLTLLSTLALVAALGAPPAPARQVPPTLPADAPRDGEAAPEADPPVNPFGDDPIQIPAPDAEPPTTPPTEPASAPYDPEVVPVQDPAMPSPDAGASLPGAIVPQGAGPVADDAAQGEPFAPKAESIRPGPNSVGLTAEVTAPPVVNLNLESELSIVVRNTGPADAANVRVRYPKPPNLTILSSDPPETTKAGDFSAWEIRSLPSGQQKILKLKVRYTSEEPVDHVATVTLQAAAKARTQVRKPDLRVEVRTDKPKVLKGDRVVFEVNVSNFGNYRARDVVVRATLGSGLTHAGGRSLELALKDEPLSVPELAPGQTVGPLKLEVEARAMGDQLCEVVVTSPDIPNDVIAPACHVEVVAPKLSVELDGPAVRHPGSVGKYTLTVTNDGSDAAHNVLVAIRIPLDGDPIAAQPERFRWEKPRRTIYWQLKDLPAGETQVFHVEIRMGGVGSLPVVGGVKAENVEPVSKPLTTQIEGIARLVGSVSEPRGVLDVNEETEYQIRLENVGTRDAEDVRVHVKLSPNLQAVAVTGADGKEIPLPADGGPGGEHPLPAIERLPYGDQAVLTVRARAVQPGVGSCQATILHKDIKDEPITTSVITHVSAPASTRR